MYYGGSRTSYNFSTDLSLSSLASRNPAIQRVINSDYGFTERSRSPVRDYGSSMSRFTAYRPLPSVLSGDTSPTLRRRDALSSHENSRSSPVTFHNDDLGYGSKTRNYYDFPTTTTGLFTSYSTTPIKKPKRIDYSDYLRPVMSDRPMIKSGYCPRSRAERESVSNPIVRERKLIKFREMSDDVLEKIRRKMSWDLPEEISSPLIDEMKQKNAESISENCEQVKSRENSLSRRGSKDIASPLSGSPRPSLSRRSSGDQSLDRSSGRPMVRKPSSRSNSLIGSSIEGIFDSKPDDLNVYSKVPVPPPRKKSIGSTHKVKKPRKSSIEILLSEEKTLNYSKVADDIRRNREIAESLKKLANETMKENQQLQNETTAEENDKEQSCTNELKTIEETSEGPDRGRRRRRRESVPEPCVSEEKPPEARRRCRSRFGLDESREVSNTSIESEMKAADKFEDEAPRPVSRMHRKSVKYKSDCLRSSKGSDIIPEPSVQKTSASPTGEANQKNDRNAILGKEASSTLPQNKLIPESKTKPVSDQKKFLSSVEEMKPKGDQKETQLDKKSNTEAYKINKLETTSNKSVFETRMLSHKNIKTEREIEAKIAEKKYSKIENKTTDNKKSPEKTSDIQNKVDANISLDRPAKIVSKISDKNFNIEKKETDAKTSLELPSKRDQKLPDVKKKATDEVSKIEKKEIDHQGKTSKFDSKIQDTKNSFANKTAKTGSNETEAKYLNKISEDVTKKLDLKDSSANKSSKIQNKEKDAQSVPDTHISEIESKSYSKSLKNALSKMEQNKVDSSMAEKKALKTDFKRSDTGNHCDNSAKSDKETKLKLSDQNTTKGLRKFDEKQPVNDKFQKAEINCPTATESQGKLSKEQKQKCQIESVSTTKLPENKEIEEIVVVCKLPKKNDLSQAKKSIPNEQNVVVSIKNSALKTVDLTVVESSEMTKDTLTEHKIIPAKQSIDSKLGYCNSYEKQGAHSREEPEINVTHTVVLKPKTPNKSLEIQSTCNKEKNDMNGNVRLKPIPDVIKSTVNAGAKADSDISDIIKSTLSKGDDQSKMKTPLLGIKSDSETNNTKNALTSSKALISNEKTSSTSVMQERNKNFDLKPLENENHSKVSIEATSEKKLSTVKKSTSAVFGNKKDDMETQNLLKVKKSSSTGFDYEKDQVNGKSEIKPDLIQMTAKSNDISPTKLANGRDSNQSFVDQKINYKIQNDKAEVEKNSSNEIKNLHRESEAKEKGDIDSISKIPKDTALYSNSAEIVDKRTTLNNAISKADRLVSDKIEPSLAKNFEGKDSDIKKIKPEKIECEVKSTITKNADNNKDKIGASESLRVLGKGVADIVDNKQINKVSGDKIKPVHQNLEEKVPELKLDVEKDKKDEGNLKKLSALTPVGNEVKNKRNAAPAYKKSVTVSDIGALLQESNTTEKVVSANAQKIKKDEPASLSSGNVPVTLLGEKQLKQDDIVKQTFKHKNETTETLKTGKKRNELSDLNKSNETTVNSKVQLPKIGDDDIKSIKDSKDLKSVECKSSIRDEMLISNKKIEAEQTNDKEACRIDQRKSFNKKQKLKTDANTELKTEIITEEAPKSDGKQTFSTVKTTVQSKTYTGVKDNDSSSQKSKEISLTSNKNATLENIMPKICDSIPLEKDKEKQKLTVDNLKLPAVPDASKFTKNLSQQEPNDSFQTQNKLDSNQITLVESVMKKSPIAAQTLGVDENIQKNILEKPKNCLGSHKSDSDAKGKSFDEESSNLSLECRKKSEISSTDSQIDSNIEILPTQKQTFDSTKVTKESQPPKPSKVKQPKLPPVPRPYNRYGLFIRPKEAPKTILESSSSEEESETETESSEEEPPTPVVNKGTHLANGRFPDRIEKARTQSETSNASIYSTLSNSTTCTTFSTSSLDDEYSNALGPQEKTKTLKFRKYNIDDFVLLKLLGKGSFGKVLLAELRNSEMYFAIKCLKKDVVMEDDDVESTMIERRVLALGTQHPYMCKLYCTFQTKSYLYFVMEYLNGGDLMFHIQETGRFDEKRAMFYGAEIVSALKFLHKRGIVYRDTKLDNVMLDEQGHVRLVDFGMCQCRIYKEECMPSNFCGTPAYIAPEIVLGQKYNQSVDWWSFGVLLYEMLIGRSPFQGTDEDELFWSICNEEPHFPRFLSKEAVHILGLLLVKTPSKRLGMSSCPAGDIKDHAFFSTINWDKIEQKQVPPVFKPSVSGPCDTSNFDSSFTTDAATLSPVDSEVLKSMDQAQFHGFSYTNPHLTG